MDEFYHYVVSAYDKSDRVWAFIVNNGREVNFGVDRSPNNLYTLDLATKKLTKLTDSMTPQIEAADLVDAEVVRFKARDGMTVPNILWKPHQATPTTKAPALVYVHGGPEIGRAHV